jgi:hypothetical protein
LVQFSYFALSDPFSAVQRALGPIFMFCAPGLVFVGIEGVVSRLYVLHSRTHFRRYRGRRVQSSCFVLPDLCSGVPRASGPVFIFCAPKPIFDSCSGVPRASGPVFMFCAVGLVLAVPWTPRPIFMFCASGLIFGGTEGVGSSFHSLRYMTHARRYRGRRV